MGFKHIGRETAESELFTDGIIAREAGLGEDKVRKTAKEAGLKQLSNVAKDKKSSDVTVHVDGKLLPIGDAAALSATLSTTTALTPEHRNRARFRVLSADVSITHNEYGEQMPESSVTVPTLTAQTIDLDNESWLMVGSQAKSPNDFDRVYDSTKKSVNQAKLIDALHRHYALLFSAAASRNLQTLVLPDLDMHLSGIDEKYHASIRETHYRALCMAWSDFKKSGHAQQVNQIIICQPTASPDDLEKDAGFFSEFVIEDESIILTTTAALEVINQLTLADDCENFGLVVPTSDDLLFNGHQHPDALNFEAYLGAVSDITLVMTDQNENLKPNEIAKHVSIHHYNPFDGHFVDANVEAPQPLLHKLVEDYNNQFPDDQDEVLRIKEAKFNDQGSLEFVFNSEAGAQQASNTMGLLHDLPFKTIPGGWFSKPSQDKACLVVNASLSNEHDELYGFLHHLTQHSQMEMILFLEQALTQKLGKNVVIEYDLTDGLGFYVDAKYQTHTQVQQALGANNLLVRQCQRLMTEFKGHEFKSAKTQADTTQPAASSVNDSDESNSSSDDEAPRYYSRPGAVTF